MKRQSVIKAQKPKHLTFLPHTDILQRKTINRTDFGASTVDTGNPTRQQIGKPDLPGAETHFCYDFSKIPVTLNSPYLIQTKLKIGQPDDKYEQEADRTAEQVMRMPGSRLSSSAGDSSLANTTIPRSKTIQRVCATCSEEYKSAENEDRPAEPANPCSEFRIREQGLIQTKQIPPLIQRLKSFDKELIQAKTTGDVTPEVTPAVSSSIQLLQGGGRPLPRSERSFFEPRFGADFSNVRVHNNTRAARSARSVNARAFTLGHNVVFGPGEYSPNALEGRKLLAHELTHVLQQNGGRTVLLAGKNSENTMPNSQELNIVSPESHELMRVIQQRASSAGSIQRDLALPLPNPNAAEPVLSDAEVRDAIRFNARRYREDVIRLIQDVVGANTTGTMDEETVRLIALIQAQFNLADADGKVGPDTFDVLVGELSAENAPNTTCLTMFRIRGPRIPMDLRVAGPGRANIFSRFDVEARFSPRCNCRDFEYRQFICGTVTRTRGGVVTGRNGLFTIPGGGLPACPGWVQDGNTTEPNNGRYGHRTHAARVNNRYLDDTGTDDMRDGCLFRSFDVPGLFEVPDVSGDRYDFNMRFFGDIQRGGTRIERKFWALRDNVTIP